MKSSSRLPIILFIILSTTACLFLNVEKRGYQVLDTIPVYDESEFVQESRTTYPDSQPSIIRTYQVEASREELLGFYKTILVDQDWDIQVWDSSDPFAPSEILAQKDGWRLSILIYSSGKFIIQVFLN